MVSGLTCSSLSKKQLASALVAVARKQLHAALNNIKVEAILETERINRPPARPPALAQVLAHLVLDASVEVAVEAVNDLLARNLEKARADASDHRVTPAELDDAARLGLEIGVVGRVVDVKLGLFRRIASHLLKHHARHHGQHAIHVEVKLALHLLLHGRNMVDYRLLRHVSDQIRKLHFRRKCPLVLFRSK